MSITEDEALVRIARNALQRKFGDNLPAFLRDPSITQVNFKDESIEGDYYRVVWVAGYCIYYVYINKASGQCFADMLAFQIIPGAG